MQGDIVTVTGYAGLGNDVVWEIFQGSLKLGQSTFHLSCSDWDINTSDDCGKAEGDSKLITASNTLYGGKPCINDWIFGVIAGSGQVLDCMLTPPEPTDECTFSLGPTPDCATLGKPKSLTFLYTGAGCGASDNNQAVDKWACSDMPGVGPVSFSIIKDQARITVSPSSGVNIGNLVTVSLKPGQNDMGSEIQLNVGSHFLKIHTSCSQPLAAGDVFGSLELVKFNGQSDGADVTYAYTVTNPSNTASVALTSIQDDKLGDLLPYFNPPVTLVPGESRTVDVTALISKTITNTVIATATTVPQVGQCNAQDSVTVTVPSLPTGCELTKATAAGFNGTAIKVGNTIWFNSNFKASGVPSTGATINFINSTITINGTPYNVPDGKITFSPSAPYAKIYFDEVANSWITEVPLSGCDEIFPSGLALPVVADIPGGAKVTWQGDFIVPQGVSLSWKWSAAVYSLFPSDYDSLNVKPTHTNSCGINNSDHAGTPEAVKPYVIGGARGGGGSNFTGSWSGTADVKCP
jgi:hypothetical protein